MNGKERLQIKHMLGGHRYYFNILIFPVRLCKGDLAHVSKERAELRILFSKQKDCNTPSVWEAAVRESHMILV